MATAQQRHGVTRVGLPYFAPAFTQIQRTVQSQPSLRLRRSFHYRHGPLSTRRFATLDEDVQVADLDTILQEKGSCGVGFIASLKNERTHDTVAKVCFFESFFCVNAAFLGAACIGMYGTSWSLLGG